jgi:hypothetical protein
MWEIKTRNNIAWRNHKTTNTTWRNRLWNKPACVEALGTGLTVFAMLPVVQRVFDLTVSENKT